MRKKEIIEFQEKILFWYSHNKRDLPWRRTRDPYTILVSEVMSQQTQVSRVIPKFEKWMTELPQVTDLAKANTATVLALWSGLGYNRRALHLKKTAEHIVKEFGGQFPQDEKTLRGFPGIGEYTACALLCFAFDKQIAVVDTNVRKVILTQFKDIAENDISSFASRLLPIGKAYEWNQALMDYASVVLKQEKILPQSGIPLRGTKQSKFIGSHRYYRGQVVKLLLQKKEVSLSQLGVLIKKDYTGAQKKWLLQLLQELIDEGFIIRETDVIRLAS